MINKRGISIIVGYVLLIVIAVGISVSVYSYLRLQVPKEKLECREDIALIIGDYECVSLNKSLTLHIENKGLFSVGRAKIRLGSLNETIREEIRTVIFPENGLKPGDTSIHQILIPVNVEISERMVVELVPVQFIKDRVIICDNAIMTQPITCSNT